MNGHVTDPQGAAVPQAMVIVQSTSTGISWQAASDDEGRFTFLANRTTAVDGVLSASRIEALPLNGRNFLELALLVPGNQPTPLFDPTKSSRVLISSTGQMGRGGSITIDGQDNNDDVVGGPLLNLPIDAVQEFQIATQSILGRSWAARHLPS